MKRYYYYDPETKQSGCRIADTNGKQYIGVARCHPEDEPYANEYIGLTIAEARAEIHALRNFRDNELIPVVKTLTHLQTNMKTSKFYNPKSYEARMLRRQLKIKENELIAIKEEIINLQTFINNYIAEKDKLHKELV